MREAKRRLQLAQESGLRGAKKRWAAHSNPIANPIAKESKGKVSKGKKINPLALMAEELKAKGEWVE